MLELFANVLHTLNIQYHCVLLSIVFLITVISQEQVLGALALAPLKVKMVYMRHQSELWSSRFVRDCISVRETWDFP